MSYVYAPYPFSIFNSCYIYIVMFQVTVPETFRDITHQTNVELNCFLRQLGLPSKGKRSHKFTLLSSHLNIATHDDEEQDPFLQTLKDVSSLKDG